MQEERKLVSLGILHVSARMAVVAQEKQMAPTSADQNQFPSWLRWTALLWLIVWFVAYWRTWGPANFIHLCDIAVILTCAGLWTNNSLLISSQAVSSLVTDIAWTVDAGCKLFLGRHLIGGTDYLFDTQYPLWIRLLSLFHVILPILLLWALHRRGYDRRGWAVQCVIVLFAFIAARFTSPADNINFAFVEPFRHHTFTPAALHVALSVLFMSFVIYLPTHLFLQWLFPPPRSA